MNNQSEFDYAWAAGFVDGEGTITIKRYIVRGRLQFQVYVQLAQVDRQRGAIAIARLKEIFGGSTHRAKRKEPYLPVCVWVITSQQAESCIERLLPYLVVKRENAELALRFMSERILYRGGRSNPMPQSELDKRESFWQQMRQLHAKSNIRLQRLSEETSENDEATV